MICSRCHDEHQRDGQRLCRPCHALSMREYRRRVKQGASRDFSFISREITDVDEIAEIGRAVASLEAVA